MSDPRERPYVQFNFLVDLGSFGGERTILAGFQEVSGIGMEVTQAEYRTGNYKENSVMKITGLNKSTDVTLKRGIIGARNLYDWLHEIREGENGDFVRPTVDIKLLDETGENVVFTWSLKNARIIKHTSGPLNAKGTDVAMEEMVLSYERLEMK